MIKKVCAVYDETSGHEALYVDGELVHTDVTIYLSEFSESVGASPLVLEHLCINLPDVNAEFPQSIADCRAFSEVPR